MKTHCRQIFQCLLILCAFATLPTFAQTSPVHSLIVEPHPVNLDFEMGELGHVPDGWVSPVPKGYAVELSDLKAKSGSRSALVKRLPDSADETGFGNIMQAIDATPFRGKRVRFRAAVRIESVNSTARSQLWMRVDRSEKRAGFFDNMGDRPVTSADWAYYEIVGDVDEDATVINIGMILLGNGKAWLDAASFEDLGKLVIRSEPARPLTRRGLENVIAFTRLLGYVRHFHPSDEAAATDWNKFAIESMSAIESAKDSRELAKSLELVFRPIAPTVRVFLTGKTIGLPDALKPPKGDTLKIVSWRHVGFGPNASESSVYRSERVQREVKSPDDSPVPEKPLSASLGGGVSCLVPMALYEDSTGTLPHRASVKTEPKVVLEKYSGNDRATRLADVVLAWNVLQHFYPYFDVVKTDWQMALKDALTSAATDQNEQAFLNTLRRMIAQLKDGHGGVYPSDLSAYAVPVIFGWVEGQLIITEIADAGNEGLLPGDVVVKVDGKSSADVLVERENYISGATPQWRRYRSVSELRLGQKDSELKLDVRSQNGQVRSLVLRRTISSMALREARPPKVSELKPGIFYIDIGRIKDEDFLAVLPKLESAKGIVFDLRGYPSVSPMLISHLTDKHVQSARWNIPIVTTPDHLNIVEFQTDGRWELDPIAPFLKAKIAFITDGRAISYAESYMGIIEAYKLADIVGEPTAGTNGNINPITLPGNYTVVWTGMKVLKHDGSQHHGIGIYPTVPVSRTIRGVAERRDEQLERAIAVVSK